MTISITFVNRCATVVAVTGAFFTTTAVAEGLELVSVTTDGAQATNHSFTPDVSGDGSLVVFYSFANDLVPNDWNGSTDVFVRNRVTGETTRVSVTSTGEEALGDSLNGKISKDGRWVVFHSEAANLVSDDRNEEIDVFVHDLVTGETARVSVNSSGEEGVMGSFYPDVSADGRFVVFHSRSYNLSEGDTNGNIDVFMRDRLLGTTTLISIGSDSEPGNHDSENAAISADGLFVAFESRADSFDEADLNNDLDIYVKNTQTGILRRASLGTGFGSDVDSEAATISDDGSIVAFISEDSTTVNPPAGSTQAYIFDQRTQTNAIVSVNDDGEYANDRVYDSVVAGNGRFVTFSTAADNIIPLGLFGEPNQVFLHDRDLARTTLVSINQEGSGGFEDSYNPSISTTGRFIVFSSLAENLVPIDDNEFRDNFLHDGGVFGDLDDDGVVGFADLLILLSSWGACTVCEADFDFDFQVTFKDLLVLLANWTL